MSRTLKLDVFSVVGRLHEFWAWADQHTDSGEMPFTVLEDVDDVVQKRGFASEMVRVGWLADNGQDGVCVPKWDRHNGESAKKRGLAMERQRACRSRSRSESVTDMSREECDSSVTESEQSRDQRREEKSISPIVPNGDKDLDPDPLLLRAKGLFSKRPVRLPIRLDRSQLQAWKKNKGAVEATAEEDWVLLEEAYAQTDGMACQYRRKDLAQLLNNWNGEITRAVDWKKRAGAAWTTCVRSSAPVEPEGWRDAVAEMYPDAAVDLPWGSLSADLRSAVMEFMKKKEQGAENEN
jgi:hypothetical protein